MTYVRLFEYDSTQEANSYRGTDYTNYLELGSSSEDRLNEVLSTIEVTLKGMPLEKEFEPEKKFIYEVWEGEPEANGSYLQYFHVCVQEDIVSKPILSDDNYFDHHITFIEASAIAQKRIVDNISVTYKLKDVSLDNKTAINLDTFTDPNFEDAQAYPTSSHNGFFIESRFTEVEYTIGKKMRWDSAVKNQWKNMKYYQSVPSNSTRTITIPIPMLEILNGSQNSKTFRHLGYCSLKTTIVENNIVEQTNEVVGSYYTHPSRNSQEEAWNYNNNWDLDKVDNTPDKEGLILEGLEYYLQTPVPIATIAYRTRTKRVATYVDTISNRQVSIQIKPNCVYTVTTTLANDFAYYSHGYAQNLTVWTNIKNDNPTYYTNNGYPVASMSFATYATDENNSVLFWHAPEANAYDLFQKAQIATQSVFKDYTTPINEIPQTFYLEQSDKEMLQNTQIVENFYNQKNFWEILIDIGKYIHSIPKIEFGEDDRFIVKWRKLGDVKEREDSATQMSIFNSRSMENYVSACSSYISNMVQLGGVIDEWVSPKSSSEDYLVYNDVAEIKTSKPITEIVGLEVKCVENTYGIPSDQLTQSLTPTGENGYVFEENIYNCLGIDWPYTPNTDGYYSLNWDKVACKGFAIYYTLGSNIIKGLNYQLPTVNSGDYPSQYAIKNILGLLFHIGFVNNGVKPETFSEWSSIKINDFIFHIIYRTKDSVRSSQSRPDLHKYLLSSKYDRVPQHNQFNNQTDTVVDSVKFGNNIYGKLIRTGNTEYTETQWCDNLQTTKQVGELYNIRGELYYVATVKNTYYGTHIISEITYSKDYNQLSEIIGIPSEPRFYEISEQSLIDREVEINEYIVLSTQNYSTENQQLYTIRNAGWNYVRNLLFRNESEFPKYAITIFKNDIYRPYGEITGNNTFYKEVCHPVNTYSVHNTLSIEWDMEDNFSAGDQVIKSENYKDLEHPTVDNAYYKLWPVKYTDAYGRSDLVDFIVLKNINDMTPDEIRALPNSPYRLRLTNITRYIGENDFGQDPTSAQLTNFVISQTHGEPEEGDGILVDMSSVAGYPNFFLSRYNGSSWVNGATLAQYDVDLIKNGINWNAKPLTPQEFGPIALFSDNTHTPGGYEYFTTNINGLGLLKDNREAIHLNYNLQMIADDGFVLSSYLWQSKKGTLKLALLKNEINRISNATIPTVDSNIITDEYIIYAADENNPGQYIDNTIVTSVDDSPSNTTYGNIRIKINDLLSGVDLTNVKALAIVSDNVVAGDATSSSKYFVMGRNISELTDTEAKQDWYISNYDKNMFPHQ